MAVRYGRHKVHYRITPDWKDEMGKLHCAPGGRPKKPFFLGMDIQSMSFCNDTQVTELRVSSAAVVTLNKIF